MDFSSRPIFDDVVHAPATLAASLSALSLGSIGKGIDGTQTNLLVVLNALRRYEVPLIQLQLIGVTKPRAADGTSATGSSLDIPVMFDYNLGGGYSARVIQHKVMEDVIDAETEEVVVKAGIVVALKKIAATPRAGDADGVKAASEAYQSILQEIKISRHPFLRQHENINNLFFVAWADHEAFPLIALELADYGTLEDVLTVPGEGPTHNQKLNLTIDVSLGLAALHHVDIVHGDLKPANILVQHHPQRHIVAQISDFGGSAILSDGEKRPRNLTRLWWAPEVDFEMDSIDWKRADVWSYGLIVASIWNHVPSPEKRTSSCYLNMIISEFLEGRERDDRLQILKTEPDSNPASLMIRAQVELDIVNRILRNSLSSINSKRKSIQDLITDEMTGMSVEAGRRKTLDCPEPSPLGSTDFKVWSMDYRKRDKGFQRLVYTQLIASCYNLIALAQRNLDAEEPQIEPSSTSSETLHDAGDAIATESNQSELWQTSIDCLFGPSGGLIHIDDDGIDKEAILAYQVCACHWLELGTQLDDREIVRWAYMAAIGGHPQALWKAPLLEASCEYKIGSQQLRLSCLVLGAFIGSKPSLETLRLLNRPLYDSTRKAIQQRYRPDFKMGNALSLFIVWARSPHLNANECVLLDLLKTYNAELARDLLQDSSLILSDLTDQRGRNALHALTFLEDAEVDGLATACYMHKASLIHHAEELEVTTVYFNRRKIEGPPIQWAVTKGMTRLTRELLLLHDKHSVPITATMDLATQAATFHHYEILKMILDQQKTTPKLFSQRARLRLDGDNWGPFLHLLLNLALTRHDTFPLSRRLLLGANFAEARIATIRPLLEEGAAPFNTSAIVYTNGQQLSSGSSVVSVLLETDDAVSLSLLLSKIRQYPNEAAYPDSFATSLQYCIIGNRTKCFKLLLEEFPEFINHVGSLKTLTPLNVAARNHDPIYARMLLEKGADPTIFHQNFSPLTRAVIDGHLQTANVIYEALSEEQRELDFGFDKVTGFTMMGRVMSVWITRTKNQGLIHAIQWIHARGGAFLVSNNIKHFPIWLQILSRRTSHSQEHIMLDDRMLEVLFDMFPKMLDTPDPLGMFPIHWASFNGHLGAIVLLLQRNVNINAEATGHGQLKGVTAFSAVVNRLRMNPPEDIADGGKVEIRRWRQRLEQTLHHLRSNGATIGKNPSNLDAWRSLQYTVPNCSVSGIDEQDKDDELQWKKDTWPRKLPKDESSSKLNQLNGGELIDPLEKRAIQTLLAPLKADLQEKPQVDENDREAFKEYGKWLSQEITYRRNQLKDQGYLLDDEDTRGFQYDWYKWHEPSASAWDQQAPMSSTSS